MSAISADANKILLANKLINVKEIWKPYKPYGYLFENHTKNKRLCMKIRNKLISL